VAACSDHGCKDQSVILIKIAWNGSPVSKYIENPPVLVINISLVVIGFDEMTPQNMRDNDEGPDEKPPSTEENLQALGTSRRSEEE
ncbi:hypothetical protein AVEN_79969-1, partial [Araneus ventricosus]